MSPRSFRRPARNGRTPEQVRQHYEVEKELAARLRMSSATERRQLYGEVYDELFRRVPDHPQLARKGSSRVRERVASAMAILRLFLRPDTTFLEIGAGDCAVSFEICAHAKKVFAVDVSELISHTASRPGNFQLILSDGTDIPVPPASVDVAYSNQLMEHLHPDDARLQLENLVRALVPGGVYVVATPHRYSGPHDISRLFDDVATGFHLKEYTFGELSQLLHEVGFSKTEALVGFRRRFAALPGQSVI